MANTLKYTDGTGPAWVDGTTTFTATFNFQSLTGAHAYTFPNATGTVALTSNLSIYAPLASPTFTGVPAAPTPAQGTDTTQLATTAFVNAEVPFYSVAAPAIATITSGNETDVAPTTVVANFLMISAGTLTAYTIQIANGLYDGQIVFMSFNHIITTLTLGGTNFSTAGLAQPTTTTANQCIGWCWDVASTMWVRFQ